MEIPVLAFGLDSGTNWEILSIATNRIIVDEAGGSYVSGF